MYSDLFDQLGSGAGAGGRAGRGSNTDGTGSNSSSSRAAQSPPPIVACKAGKMNLTRSATTNTTATTAAFQCEADTRRGEIRLVYKDSALQWQWYDRRDEKVVDTYYLLSGGNTTNGILERVPLTGKKYAQDRIYVWARRAGGDSSSSTTANNNASSSSSEGGDSNAATAAAATTTTSTTTTTPNMQYDMYWMQDESEEKEAETVAEINKYLANPSLAAPPAGTSSGTGNTNTASTARTSSSTAAAGSASSSSNTTNNNNNNNNNQQVDALSSILENLGMPQGSGGNNNSATGTSGNGTPAGTLTLADLQSAMTSMQSSSSSPPGAASSRMVPLSEVVTPAAISSLLEHEAVRERLIRLLPEHQQSREHLEDNLRSPQIQQTLRSLTQALLPDDAGNMDGFYSVLANFNLNPNNNNSTSSSEATIAAMNNPIQAFLDAVVASVNTTESQPQGSTNDASGSSDTQGGGGDEGKDADGDAKMDDP